MSWAAKQEGELDQVENPEPQPRPDRGECRGDPVPLELAGCSLNAKEDKLAFVTVGLPGCGKTHLVRRIARYLEFFHSAVVRTFIVEDYRRSAFGASVPPSFFDESDEVGRQQMQSCWLAALADLKAFMVGVEEEQGGPQVRQARCNSGCSSDSSSAAAQVGPHVSIFDAQNLTRRDRRQALEELEAMGLRVVFIEVVTDDPALNEAYLGEISRTMPDYQDHEDAAAREDFAKRVELARSAYEPINSCGDEGHLSWIKSTNMQTLVINKVRTYLPGRIVQLMMSLHPRKRTIYLSRHGQSEYNAQGKVGGDSALTPLGQEYGRRLARFAETVICRDADGSVRPARLWTSTLRRTRQTASYIKRLPCKQQDGRPFESMRGKSWTNLDEIYAGICDGMTYNEIGERFPEEATRRGENKLTYRYPRGESYMDLIQRLEPMVHELERHEEPLLIVGHQAVLRVLYCYLSGMSREKAPRVSMPLHTVVRLEPHTYACEEERFPLMLDREGNPQDTPSH